MAELKRQHRVEATTDEVEHTIDPDTPEGKEALEEIAHINQLDYKTWLPFCADTYKISRDPEDFILVTTILAPSDIPNRNGVGFPLQELIKFQPPPIARQVYKAWAGTPLHVEHRNKNPEDAIGCVLDTSFHKVHGYGGGALWKIMALVAVDKYKNPERAEQIGKGLLKTYSMGAMSSSFACSYCGAEIDEKHGCLHIPPGDDLVFYETRDYNGESHLVFKNAYDLAPIEFSSVKSPAWAVAHSDHILHSD